MAPNDRAKYEKLLLGERKRLERMLDSVRDDLGDGLTRDETRRFVGDMSDLATEMMAREDGATQAVRDSDELSDVNEALRLLYTEPEKYGVCTVCGRSIDAARLDVLPTTRYCSKHAQ